MVGRVTDKMWKPLFITDDDILIGAMVRSYMRSNNTLGWYTEIVKLVKETKMTYVVEFDGKRHTLKKYGKNGYAKSSWDNYDDTIHFKLLKTPNDVYRFVWDYIKFIQNKFEDLQKEVAALKGKGEWAPVE